MSKFQVELINIQGEIASDKKMQRIMSLKNQTKFSIIGHNPNDKITFIS